MEITIRLAEQDDEIIDCYAVMRELRPHLIADEFLARVRQQQSSGYHLAFAEADGVVVAVAGFRLGLNLAWNRFLYVDDLVTRPQQRSRGYGRRLLSWLREYAVNAGCNQLHLDSGAQRLDAHRFYEREGMVKTGFHFAEKLET